ncbi:hypothetical protein BZG36_03970 [Bifiguratus adelaidae]|uniref:Transmembrane protein 223 n=1 Tax=Bifiguratus adelaidae TaxID=1938954 RepID=A0A261XXC5_9FUNG|nr:hypothetical protein BZG36_03970 [Bifiguratus adelaidae]
MIQGSWLRWTIQHAFARSLSTRPATKATERVSVSTAIKSLKQKLQHKDVEFYQAPASARRTFVLLYVAAGVQILFWGNLGSLAYVSYAEKKKDGAEDAQPTLASKPKRMAVAGALIGVGTMIAGAMCIYPWRYVRRITLLRGGNSLRLQTYGWGKNSTRELPVDTVYAKQKIYTGIGPKGTDALGSSASQLYLRIQSERLAYILDRKGKYLDPRVFDGVFYSRSGL